MQHQLKDLMSRDVKVIGPEMTIREAARAMHGPFMVAKAQGVGRDMVCEFSP